MFHAGPGAAFLPAALKAYEDLVNRNLVHPFVLHRRSSQAFGLNVFAPLEPEGARALLADLGFGPVDDPTVEFEYSDPLDRLGEAKPSSPHTTQVDVVLRAVDTSGQKVAALIEVKFTETDFSPCSAYMNPANPNREVCRSNGLFGNEPEQCFQISNHGQGHRRYHDVLGALPVGSNSGASELAAASYAVA